MPAIEISNEEKVDMLVANQCGETLTSIAEDYKVSCKTVRRRINEVKAFVDNLNVGDKIDYIHNDTIVEVTVSTIDEEIEDHMPIAVKFHDGVVDYVMLHDLLDAADREAIGESKYEEPEDEIEDGFVICSEEPEVNTRVKLREDSEFFGKLGNPSTADTGVVVRVSQVEERSDSKDDYFWVRWDGGGENNYRPHDVLVEEDTLDDGDLYVDVELEVDDEEDTEENAQYFVTAPQDSLTIVRIDQDSGEVSQRQTNKHNENFAELRGLIKADQSQATLSEVYKALDTKRMLKSYSVGRIKVDPNTETVVFVKPDGSERSVPDDVAMDIITTVRSYGKDQSERLVKFLDKLMDNVSFKAIEGLYRFMKHNCIEINEDGSIRAWKGVRTDLYSISSGKIKNSPTCFVRDDGRIYNGNFDTETRVDRSEVNDDPDQTCSHGLHVGNRDYANGFGQTLLAVTVEPQDVVAVPKDYNGAKMRCCAYTPRFVV